MTYTRPLTRRQRRERSQALCGWTMIGGSLATFIGYAGVVLATSTLAVVGFGVLASVAGAAAVAALLHNASL